MVDLNPVLSPCEPTVLTTTSPLCSVSKRFLSNIHCSMNELAMTWGQLFVQGCFGMQTEATSDQSTSKAIHQSTDQ